MFVVGTALSVGAGSQTEPQKQKTKPTRDNGKHIFRTGPGVFVPRSFLASKTASSPGCGPRCNLPLIDTDNGPCVARVCLSRYRQCCNPGRFWGNRHQFLGCRILSLACRKAAVSSKSSSPTSGSQTRRTSVRCNVENTFCLCREGAPAKSTLARNLFSPDCKHEPSLRRGEKNQQFQRPRRWLDAQVLGCHRRVAGSQLKLGAPAFLPSKSLAPPIQ